MKTSLLKTSLLRTVVGLLTGLLTLAAGDAASGADLSRRSVFKAPLKAPAFAAPAFSWTGFYVGGNAGYGSGRLDSAYDLSIGGLVSTRIVSDTTTPSGFIGGGQLGYNYQMGSVVLGAEADWQYSAQRETTTNVCPPVTCGLASITGITLSATHRVPWWSTVRARVGYAFDRWLVYGTGGLAYGKIESDLTASTALGSATFNTSSTRTGWVWGLGVENAFMGNWSWKAEYLYMDFGSWTVSNAIGLPIVLLATTINETITYKSHVVRVGLNYRF